MRSVLNRRCVTALLASAAIPARADQAALRALVFDVRPYGFTDKSGVLVGILVEWFRELALEAKVDVHVALAPLARVVRDFDRRQIDLTLLIASPIFVPTIVSRVIEVGAISLGVWTQNTASAKGISDLAGKKVVVLRGGSAEYLARGWPGVDVVPVGSVGSMVSMLRIGRVDALLILEPTLKAHLDLQPDAVFQQTTHRAFESRMPMSLFVGRGVADEMQSRIAHAVEVLKQARRFENLTAAYTVSKT